MTGPRFNFGSVGAERQDGENTSGLTMTDVLMLPDQQRQIVQWMMRQRDVNSAEVADYLNLDESVVLNLLDELVQQGFVQETTATGELRYRTRLARKQGHQQLTAAIEQAFAPGNPLGVIINPSGDYAIAAGGSFELCVTVSNKGYQSALIDIYIDELSELFQWCDNPRERLALGPSSSSEVFFQFEVPTQATPGTYNYLLIVDAPQHYPEDTPIRHRAKLQVLHPAEATVRVSDPTFALLPSTNSFSPALLQPGEVLRVQVVVHNRSDRVDRFRLTCPDLENSWFTVIYPEGPETLGMAVVADRLDLNPDAKGIIQLLLNVPLEAMAGRYFPSVRLYSANNPDLVLLDVVYLQILPVYLMSVELRALVSRVRRKEGLYELRVTNAGNTERDILLRAVSADEDKVCTYTISPDQLRILPKATANSQLMVKPVQWWRRPIYGGGRMINFRIEVEDSQQLSLPVNLPEGVLIWEPRPWWQFLLLVLTVVGTVAALIFLIWWLFFRPPAVPKIAQFYSEDTSYEEADGDFIRLNWEVRNPRQIQTLSLTGQSPEGKADVAPISYNFSQGVPNELKAYCALRTVLICKNVRTDARKAGNYIFELKVFSKKKKDVAADVLKTNPIKIEPIALPKIVEFTSTQPVYQEAVTAVPVVQNRSSGANSAPGETTTSNRASVRPAPQPAAKISLNWKVMNLDELQALTLIGRSPDGAVTSTLKRFDFSKGMPAGLQRYCQVDTGLTCNNVPTDARQAGDYIFELTVVTKKGKEETAESKKTDAIKIQPKPPRILEFQLNGKEAFPKYLIEINPKKPPTILALSWRVESSKGTKVELMPAPGTVPAAGKIPYILSQKAGSETITLQVTNAAGEQVSRSVTLETVEPPPLEPPSPPTTVPLQEGILPAPPPTTDGAAQAPPSAEAAGASPAASPSAGASPATSPVAGSSPSPSEPDLLSPSELPPRSD